MDESKSGISARGGTYTLRRYVNGKRYSYYSTDINVLKEYDAMLRKGIIPKKIEKRCCYTQKDIQNKFGSSEEEWKWIKGYEKLYAISSIGRLLSFHNNLNGTIIKCKNNSGWYVDCGLTDFNGARKSVKIHNIVARTFIGEIPDGYEVHHIDGNKQNNNISNLEILSKKEHCKKTIEQNPHMLDGMINYNRNRHTGKYELPDRRSRRKRKNPYVCKGMLCQLDKYGNVIDKFHNSKEAMDKTGVCQRNILQVATHEQYKPGLTRKQAGGYIWKYESEVMQK